MGALAVDVRFDLAQLRLVVLRGGQERALPFVNVTALGPITKQFTPHREGDTPRQLLDFEQSLIDIAGTIVIVFGPSEMDRNRLESTLEALAENEDKIAGFVVIGQDEAT